MLVNDLLDQEVVEVPIEGRFAVETLVIEAMNLNDNNIKDYDKIIKIVIRLGSYYYAPKKLDLIFKINPLPLAKISIKDPLVFKWKVFHSNIHYSLLGENGTLLMIVST